MAGLTNASRDSSDVIIKIFMRESRVRDVVRGVRKKCVRAVAIIA